MDSTLKYIKYFHRTSSTILKSLLVLLLIPIFISCICPIYLVRAVVLIASKILRPDLVEILGVRDTFYGIDDINSAPKSSVVITLILDGRFDRHTAVSRMQSVVSKPGTKKFETKYPELRRHLVKWMGFLFWKEDQDFRVENHVHYHNQTGGGIPDQNGNLTVDQKIDDEYLKRLERQVVNEPYCAGRSAWEMKIVPNYVPAIGKGGVTDYTAILFKIHHSFVDGYSLVRLAVTEVCDGSLDDIPLPQFPAPSCLRDFLLSLFLLFKAPYDALSEVLETSDRNILKLAEEKVTNEITSALSPPIPAQLFKNVAQHFQVSFTAVVVGGISGGIRKWAAKNGKSIPDSFKCLCPFPVPGHPDRLGNYLSDCSVEFPTGLENYVARLRSVEGNLKKLKRSTIPLSSFAVQPFLGGLFTWMLEPLVKFACSKSTGVISSFPGPRKQIKWCGFPVNDIYFTGGHDSPGFGIQFLAINYNGKWKLKIQADKAVVPSDAEAEEMLNYVIESLDEYFRHVLV